MNVPGPSLLMYSFIRLPPALKSMLRDMDRRFTNIGVTSSHVGFAFTSDNNPYGTSLAMLSKSSGEARRSSISRIASCSSVCIHSCPRSGPGTGEQMDETFSNDVMIITHTSVSEKKTPISSVARKSVYESSEVTSGIQGS